MPSCHVARPRHGLPHEFRRRLEAQGRAPRSDPWRVRSASGLQYIATSAPHQSQRRPWTRARHQPTPRQRVRSDAAHFAAEVHPSRLAACDSGCGVGDARPAGGGGSRGDRRGWWAVGGAQGGGRAQGGAPCIWWQGGLRQGGAHARRRTMVRERAAGGGWRAGGGGCGACGVRTLAGGWQLG